MKKSLVCIVILSCFYLVLSQQYIEPLITSPAFLWSNKKFLLGQNIQVTSVASMKDIEHVITGKPSLLSPYIAKNSPEVIFVFVEPELTTNNFMDAAGSRTAKIDGGQFVNLKNLLESSTSSLIVPYVSAAATLVPSLQRSRAIVMSPSQLKAALADKNNWEVLNNGVTDVIVVQFENSEYTTHDSLLASVDSAMQSTSYAGVLTSSSAASFDLGESFPLFASIRAASNGTGNNSNGTNANLDYWPDGIVEGLIIMIPFLFILFLGICCTFSVQSGLKFETEKLKKQ